MNVYLEPQQRIQARISNYREDCEKLSDFLKEWQAVVAQIKTVERKRESILRSESTRAIEEISSYVRTSLKCQMADIQKIKAKLFDQFGKIERSFEDIFGDAVAISEDDRSSGSADGGRAQLVAESGLMASTSDSKPSRADEWGNDLGSSSSEGRIIVGLGENVGGGTVEKKDERKDRVLVGVKETGKMDEDIVCVQAVYNWETREVMFHDGECGVIRVIGVNEANDKLELKKTMDWEEVRGTADLLDDICMEEVSNTMYGVVTQKEGEVKRVEELDRHSLKKKESSNTELDTRGLLNGKSVHWFLLSKRDTIALVVSDLRDEYERWDSVAIYRNRVRRVHTLSHLDMKLDCVNWSVCLLVNETTLLLSCGSFTKKKLQWSHCHHNHVTIKHLLHRPRPPLLQTVQ